MRQQRHGILYRGTGVQEPQERKERAFHVCVLHIYPFITPSRNYNVKQNVNVFSVFCFMQRKKLWARRNVLHPKYVEPGNGYFSLLRYFTQRFAPPICPLSLSLSLSLTHSLALSVSISVSGYIYVYLPPSLETTFFSQIQDKMDIRSRVSLDILLVDRMARVRWRGSGQATPPEIESMIRCARQLVEGADGVDDVVGGTQKKGKRGSGWSTRGQKRT